MVTPLVSIVTVNFNEPEVTEQLLISIQNNSYKNIEVIVVDNGCTKGVELLISSSFPHVNYISSNENLGFAGGNNLGIKQAKGDFVFLVNNDTEFVDGLIEGLLYRFGTSKKIGVVSPKIRFFHLPNVIQYAGYSEMNPFTARNKAYGSKEKDEGQCDIAMETPFGHGAALMFRRELVDIVGALPEVFFLYYEELDWCEQIRRAGYEVWYEPKATIYHKESVSVGKMSAFKTYYLTRNRILFVRRNMDTFQKICFSLFFVFLTIPKNTFLMIFKRQWSHLRAFWKGVIWNFKN